MSDETKVKVSETGLAELVEKLSAEFDHRVAGRHVDGAAKYGPFAFFNKDMFEEAMQEILDNANYCRYAYIKLRLTQLQIAEEYQTFLAWRERTKSEYTPDGSNHPERPEHGFRPAGG